MTRRRRCAWRSSARQRNRSGRRPQAHGVAELVSFVPPVPRREAYQHQVDADALLLVTAPGVRSVATSKLYDYIGAGRPILALAQDNAAAEIVERFELGLTAPPGDSAAIAAAIRELMRRQAAGYVWDGFDDARPTLRAAVADRDTGAAV